MKKIMALLLALCLMLSLSISASAVSVAPVEEELIRQQVIALIADVDEVQLKADALANVVDYSVPAEIRNSVIAKASFQPTSTLSRGVAEEIPLDVTTTVKKVGEVYRQNGDELNLYVAVAAVSPKEDSSSKSEHGIKAWALIYWIDNLGMNNELYGAAGQWDPQGKVVENRQVWYGHTDIFFLKWVDGVTVQFPTENWAYYEDPGKYSGFVLGCETRIDVVNLGTVRCSVTSGILT